LVLASAHQGVPKCCHLQQFAAVALCIDKQNYYLKKNNGHCISPSKVETNPCFAVGEQCEPMTQLPGTAIMNALDF